MKFFCDSKYLLFPASHHAQNKRVYFRINGELVYDLVIPLDYFEPDYTFPLNVERFAGQEIELTVDPEMELKLQKSNQGVSEADAYSGKYRPLAHFTAKRGWLNDPNGLVFYQGKYLMFYQHNPVACTWENMHWGYAVSDDLMHWREQEMVLYPDQMGTIFSGSAIIDTDNVTGLRENENDVILLFYTAAGSTSKTSEGKPFTQSLAYSTDGGKTFQKYAKNPLIDQIVPGNRDPKVIRYEPSGDYIMALYLEEHEFALYTSKNLLDWKMLQKIDIPDEIECPDFYPLPVDGDPDHIKWVLIGASDKYLIGDFDGTTFTPESGPKALRYGNSSYAAQSWSNIPNGRRIRTTSACATIPGMPFASCMSIPQEMSLRTINGAPYLCATPVPEIKALYSQTKMAEKVEVSENHPFHMPVNGGAYDISLKVSFSDHAAWSLSLLGLTLKVSADKGLITCMDHSAPVDCSTDVVELRILLDTIYTEIFVNQGSTFMGISYVQDKNLDTITISSPENNILVEKLSITGLNAFWQ